MKALKIIGIIIVVAFATILIIGFAVPFYEYESSVQVNATPEKCWKVYNDVKLLNQWLPGFESLTLKSGDSLTAGSMYEIIINDGGERMVMNEKIVDVNAPTKITYELTNDVLKSEFSFSFEGSSSTTIKSNYKITGNNVIWSAVLFLSKSYMTSSANGQLTSLKKLIEQQP